MLRKVVLFLGLMAAMPGPVRAQAFDSLPELPAAPPVSSQPNIKLWHVVAAVGGLSALMVLDHPVQRYAIHNSGPGADEVAGAVRHFGQPEVYATATLGLLATGLVTGQRDISLAGRHLAFSLVLAGLVTEAGKTVLGRPRPESSLDADGYVPFSGQASFPSGHTSISFAMATSLADDIHRPWATVGLYGLATAVGWSRINDNRHWLTDVAAGALVGITSAKVASGRWRIFGLRAPTLITGSQGAGLGWHTEFRLR